MKQVFVISKHSVASKYGVGTYVRQLVKCFDLTQWEVNIVQLYAEQNEYTKVEEDKVIYHNIPCPFSYKMYGDKKQTGRYYKHVFYFLSGYVHSKEIYCHFNFFIYELAMMFKEKLNAKNILTVHYMQWSFNLLGDRMLFEKILLHPESEKDKFTVQGFEDEKLFMHDGCDQIIAIARHSYDTLNTLYGIPESKLAYIPNAIEDNYLERTREELNQLRRKYNFDMDEKLIIFSGRLDPVKGIIKLLESFKSLPKEISKARLIVVGDGDFASCFEVINPMFSKITFTGFVTKPQLYELYAIADLGAVLSLHEEFGYVAVEMMMNGLPVVVNDTTGLKEITDSGKYGMLVHLKQDSDISFLKNELLQPLLNAGLLKHYSRMGRIRFEQEYTFDIFRERIKLLYQTI